MGITQQARSLKAERLTQALLRTIRGSVGKKASGKKNEWVCLFSSTVHVGLLGVLKSIGGLCVSRDMGMLVCPVCGVCVSGMEK